MDRAARDIDHVMLIARDLARARLAYEKMGFTVTPLTSHPHGTANHLIMFQHDFIELLGVVSPEKLDSRSAAAQLFLAAREGLAAVALPSNDAKRDREALVRRGLEPSDLYSFDRPVTLPDGRETRAIVDTVWASEPSAPLVQTFLSQQHVAEAIWVPEWQVHPNGARTIAWLTLVADEPAAALERHLATLMGTEISRDAGDRRILAARRGQVRILSPGDFEAAFGRPAEAVRPYIAGVGIGVVDLGRLVTKLEENGVPHDRSSQIVRVLPDSAHGALIEFTERSAEETTP
jgi:hypothetical protein